MKLSADAGEKCGEILAKNSQIFALSAKCSQKILHIFHEGRNKILSQRDSGSGGPAPNKGHFLTLTELRGRREFTELLPAYRQSIFLKPFKPSSLKTLSTLSKEINTLARKDYIHKCLFSELVSPKSTCQLQEIFFRELISRNLHITYSLAIPRITWNNVLGIIFFGKSHFSYMKNVSELISQSFLAGV